MQTTAITDLGSVGLVADKEAVTLPPNAWSEIQNIRFEDRSLTAFLGHESFGTITVQPETITSVKTNGGSIYFVYAQGDSVYSFLGAETDISGKTFLTSGWWDSCILGGVAIINNGVENPQYWGGVGLTVDLPYDSTDPDDICTWDMVGMTAKVIRPFRYHLFAFDILDCDGRNRRKVWWSTPAEPGTVPITWDVTKPEYDAGFVELSDTAGSILDALAMRDTLQIYKEDAVYSCSYTGRQDNQIFNFRLVTDARGLYARNCVCDVGGRHFFVSDGDIYIYDGTNFRSIADERVKNHFFRGVNAAFYQKSFCTFYHRTGEVWLCYPGLGSEECNTALVWDSNSDTWSKREIPSANCATFAVTEGSNSGYNWEDAVGITWEDWPSTPLIEGWIIWSYPVLDTALKDSLVLAGATDLFEMDKGNTADGTNMVCYARRTHLDLGDKMDWHMVTRIMPHADGDTFRVRIGHHNQINQAVTWSDYQTFTPGTDYKLDFRSSGRLHAIEFSSTADVSWRVSGYEVEFTPVGRR